MSQKSNFGRVFAKDDQLTVDEVGQFRNLLKRLDQMAKVIFQSSRERRKN